ncbi:hypothetical protein QVD17_15584 [Tagetes erecta]|uniref:Nuclear speckle splicing regulatory protein 1 N-terminal domain-containing protein n=1 Tax=Tagetes erecta TaxID=13708 RepID=A0AAD8NZT5_TARER|nr:hypothetical protein QVD17_15584 [Tagetes erecta]
MRMILFGNEKHTIPEYRSPKHFYVLLQPHRCSTRPSSTLLRLKPPPQFCQSSSGTFSTSNVALAFQFNAHNSTKEHICVLGIADLKPAQIEVNFKMKYGLNLRAPSSQQKKQPTRPIRPSALGFGEDDDDDIEREISRQAGKNKALKDVEEQHKKALEEDPSVFDYDGVYDDMKEKAVRPVAQDRQERKSRYIQALIDKAKVREREHEIVYERKLAKERSKEDHLFADKDKFVTGAYKRKLAEQAKWLEEERLRQLREEKEDITKKGGDMTEFYFNLSKNVAFGARDGESTKVRKHTEESKSQIPEESQPSKVSASAPEENIGETSAASSKKSETVEAKPVPDSHKQEVINVPQNQESGTEGGAVKPPTDHHKRNQDALAAAKERFLARKKMKENAD